MVLADLQEHYSQEHLLKKDLRHGGTMALLLETPHNSMRMLSEHLQL
jgi:hypothetical protein